ncbi:hypothetical protein DOM21_14895 [Bacteriovorax stolpii]|uniref:hypothetical protein n=1 Tax=Bacteriovorax stolpii TaxID=960 RepID=UPI00115B62DE|nr:hypothetical protein [Bacteriovorax stolpii]QDK42714.1 hypothetical protein DOM21_14895 [Bacteriovorax stolpii]
MIETNLLKNLLLVSNPKVMGLSEYLSQVALMFVLPAFYIGMIVEYFTSFDFKSVAKRALIAFLAIKLFLPVYTGAVDVSLKTSSELLSKYSSHNKFLSAYQSASVATNSNAGIWDRLKSIVSIIMNDPIVVFIFIMSYTSFFLLTQLYSLIYHLGIAFFGVCAVLSILPITQRSLTGAVYTGFWCALMPFVVMIVLALIGDSDAFLRDYSGGIVQNLESLIQLLVMTILLLLTPVITTKILNGTGLNAVADNLGQMAAMATLIGGTKVVASSITKGGAILGGGVHNATTKPFLNYAKERISQKAGQIAKEKGLGPSLNTLTNESYLGRIKGGINDFKEGMGKTDLKEKAILGADSIFNRRENKLANVAREKDAHDLKDYQATRSQDARYQYRKVDDKALKIPLSGYKEEARGFQLQSQAMRDQSKGLPEAQSFLRDRNLKDIKQPPRPNFRDAYSRPQTPMNPFRFNRERLAVNPEKNTKLNLFQFRKWEGNNGRSSAIQRHT